MKQDYLVKALEKLEEEAQNDNVLKAVHSIIEPMLYELDDEKLQPIADGKKSYAGAIKEVEAVALKNKKGSVGVVPPDEAEKIIKAYFGIDSAAAAAEKKKTVSIFEL